MLVSSAFAAAALDEDRTRLVSVGRYALRGVARPEELFTLATEEGIGIDTERKMPPDLTSKQT